jgi:hypothetical protein
MAWYMLKPPVQFYQDTDAHCWAAGAASWLRTTHIGNATPDVLVQRYKDYCDGNGYLVEDANSDDLSVVAPGGIVEVFRLIGVILTRRSRSDFTYDFAKAILTQKGHFLLVASRKDTDVVGHTRVVYGVGVPDEGSFSAFNPYRNENDRPQGYENVPFSDFNSDSGFLYVGWARWAGPDLS